MATYSDQQDHFSNFVLKRKQLTSNNVNSNNFSTWFTTPSNKYQFWLWLAPETRNSDYFTFDWGIRIKLNEYPYLNSAIAGGESRVRQSREFNLVTAGGSYPYLNQVVGYRYTGSWLQAMNSLGQSTGILLNAFSITDESDENEDYMTAASDNASDLDSATVPYISGLIAPDTQVQYDIPSIGPTDGNYEWYINLIYLECDYVGYDPSYPLNT